MIKKIPPLAIILGVLLLILFLYFISPFITSSIDRFSRDDEDYFRCGNEFLDYEPLLGASLNTKENCTLKK